MRLVLCVWVGLCFLLAIGAVSAGSSPSRSLPILTADEVKVNSTSPEIVQVVYQMIKDVLELCKRSKIPIWAEGGTLLGAIREKGLIKWDDDGDFGIPIRFISRFFALSPTLNSLGYTVSGTRFGIKVFLKNGTPAVNNLPFTYPFMDIFVSHTTLDNIITTTHGPLARCYFFLEELFPLMDCEFGPITVPCAHNSVPYLNRCYGTKSDWKTTAYLGYDHKKEQLRESRMFKLENSNRAVPQKPLEDRLRGKV